MEKGGAVFGNGTLELLTHIDRHGSLSSAAEAMGMSYRAAWGKIKHTEQCWGITLLETRVGGREGGGSVLTAEAQELMEGFRCWRKEVQELAEKKFEEILQKEQAKCPT